MSYMTHETMDMIGRDYDEDMFAAQQGVYDAERFVSESDYDRADCIHPHTVEFPTVDICTYCGTEIAR
jgi:hypothetical protein